jgi:hypothetical protein
LFKGTPRAVPDNSGALTRGWTCAPARGSAAAPSSASAAAPSPGRHGAQLSSLDVACHGARERGEGQRKAERGGERTGRHRPSLTSVLAGHRVDNPAAAGARHRHKGKEKHKEKERGETPAASGRAALGLTVAGEHGGHRRFTRRRRCGSERSGEKRERARVCRRFGRGGRFCLGDKAGGPSIKMDGQGSLRASGR